MKKYLMTGIAAVAMCAAFTSCSHDIDPVSQEDLNKMAAEKVVNDYNQAFIATFGQPAANQDWGFGTGATRGITRALSDYDDGSNKNRNMWAATNGPFNLLVPTPLTDGQRLRVRAYFQAHPNLEWEVPNMTNYFVQQVYTGNPETKGAYSDERYTELNGTPVIGSAHMDKLTIAGEHVYDFNGADNVNTATDVLNNGELQNSQNFHSDQITLILNTRPTWVGYETSEASILKNDCMALASAKDIDDWAIENKTALEAAGLFGENVWYGKDQYGYDNSSWNRSFVGLDYEQIPEEDAYATVAWNDPTTRYVKVDDLQPSYIWDSKANTYQTKAEYKAANGEYLLDEDGHKIPYISVNTNTILGQTAHFANQTDYMPQVSGYGMVFDIQKIYAKVKANCLPVVDKSLQEWVKNIGGRDYVFTDWIVTLAPARPNTQIPSDYDVRIIAEDLNASAEVSDKGDSDWDFNDVVLDVDFTGANTCKVRITAAGGTLPLIVGVPNPIDGQEYPNNEVHAKLGVAVNIMVNTNAHLKNLPSATVAEANLPTLDLTIDGVQAQNGRNIPIFVQKVVNGQPHWFELTANEGQPASKIAVSTDFRIVNERDRIDSQAWYPLFPTWVENNDPLIWWRPLQNQ
ncbi:MAG: hypothetical protein IKO73_04755 [Bacteroidaceae bacterium]|jgi:hypothetical protein|nr:hypothetical protein [Bacteroidaceae bacterium]